MRGAIRVRSRHGSTNWCSARSPVIRCDPGVGGTRSWPQPLVSRSARRVGPCGCGRAGIGEHAAIRSRSHADSGRAGRRPVGPALANVVLPCPARAVMWVRQPPRPGRHARRRIRTHRAPRRSGHTREGRGACRPGVWTKDGCVSACGTRTTSPSVWASFWRSTCRPRRDRSGQPGRRAGPPGFGAVGRRHTGSLGAIGDRVECQPVGPGLRRAA